MRKNSGKVGGSIYERLAAFHDSDPQKDPLHQNLGQSRPLLARQRSGAAQALSRHQRLRGGPAGRAHSAVARPPGRSLAAAGTWERVTKFLVGEIMDDPAALWSQGPDAGGKQSRPLRANRRNPLHLGPGGSPDSFGFKIGKIDTIIAGHTHKARL